MNEIDLEMYSDPALAVPVVPKEMRICEVNRIFLRPNVAYIFTVDPNCARCVEYAGVYAEKTNAKKT